MRFLQLLPFASLALAIANPNSNAKRQSSCTSEPWAIQQYHSKLLLLIIVTRLDTLPRIEH